MNVKTRDEAVQAYAIGKKYIAKFGIDQPWKAYSTFDEIRNLQIIYFEGNIIKAQKETSIMDLEEILFKEQWRDELF